MATELSNVPLNPGNWSNAADIINENSSKINTEFIKLENATTKFKGFFTSLAQLQAAWPSPIVGDIAWIGTTYPGTVHDVVNGQWHDTTVAPSVGTVNLSEYSKLSGDEELTGIKKMARGLELKKGFIAYGQDTLLTGVGRYVAAYVSPTFGSRILSYDGVNYYDLVIGAYVNGKFGMTLKANGEVAFGHLKQTTGDDPEQVMSQDAVSKEFASVRSDLSEIEQEQIQGGVYDVSSHNDGAVFESLSTLLGSANLSTLIPTSVRRGGMSIRFIQGSVLNSNNKYVKYFLTKDEWSTSEGDWEKMNLEEEVIQLGQKLVSEIICINYLFVRVPSSTVGNDGDYAAVFLDTTNHRVYKKESGSWNIYTDYVSANVHIGSMCFYKKSNQFTDVFRPYATNIVKAQYAATPTAQTPGNDGDIILQKGYPYLVYVYNNDSWYDWYDSNTARKLVYDTEGVLFGRKIVTGTDSPNYRIVDLSSLQISVEGLQTDVGELQTSVGGLETEVEAINKQTIENVVVSSVSGVMPYTTPDKPSLNLINLMPGKTYKIYYKAQYTGKFALYAAAGHTGKPTQVLDVSDTDFTSGITCEVTMPDNTYVLRTRTFLANVTINELTAYEEVRPTLNEVKFNGLSAWSGKTILCYGDSVTAICNGDFTNPYILDNASQNWMQRMARYLNFGKCKGRGIGGQSFCFASDGGSLAWCRKDNGAFVGRNDSYTYEDYLEDPTIASQLTGYDASIHTLLRGSLSSWLHITSLVPASIKDTIDVITIMCHNDVDYSDTILNANFQWSEGSTDDPEWATSSYYSAYGGDYNLKTSVKGAIASTIMKLQAWMPNATIVLMTPISGKYVTGALNPTLTTAKMEKLADIVRDMHKTMSIPLIDMYATDGINGLNRTTYIADNIHPYSVDGSKMLARAVTGGLVTVFPQSVF